MCFSPRRQPDDLNSRYPALVVTVISVLAALAVIVMGIIVNTGQLELKLSLNFSIKKLP